MVAKLGEMGRGRAVSRREDAEGRALGVDTGAGKRDISAVSGLAVDV